jgi:hypothetical protein
MGPYNPPLGMVPEPVAHPLVLAGLACGGALAWRRKRA